MKRITKLAAVGAVLVLLGCSDPPVEGEVTHKQHSDAYSYVTMHCIAHDPKTYACTGYMPIVNNMPASWQLCLTNREDKTRDKYGCFEVPESVWGSYNEGDYYPRDSR